MNTDSTQESTGLSTQEAAASIAKQLFPETDTQERSDDKAGERDETETDEVDGEEQEAGEEEDGSEEVEATNEDESESDEEETTEADEGDKDTPRYTVKVDGKEVEVPLPELLAGYSRQSDYTRKTQALAAKEREFQPQVEAVQQERAQYAHLLGILKQQVEHANPVNIDWKARFDADPIQAAQDHALWTQERERIKAIESEQTRVSEAQKKADDDAAKAWFEEQNKLLVEKVPLYRDPKKAQAEHAAIRDYAVKSLGFTPEDLKGIGDHRVLITLRKAWQFDQLMAKSKTTKPQVPKAKTATPGAAQSSRKGTDAARATKRLSESGSLSDAAAVIRQRLG
jgi:hypothetical protein